MPYAHVLFYIQIFCTGIHNEDTISYSYTCKQLLRLRKHPSLRETTSLCGALQPVSIRNKWISYSDRLHILMLQGHADKKLDR